MELFSSVTRFAKKRVEEDLEVARRNLSHLKAQNEGTSVTDKLQEELGEYRKIVKCSICRDRTKEVIFLLFDLLDEFNEVYYAAIESWRVSTMGCGSVDKLSSLWPKASCG